MKQKVRSILANKQKTIPVLSFPSTELLGITVNELIGSAERQAQGMKAIADRCPVGASLNMMDLSVEAEAFGAKIQYAEHENPTVIQGIIDDITDAPDIAVPAVGSARSGIYIEGIKKAKEIIIDIPVFCGVIGPYSLAGRLFDMTELMMECYDSPDEVHALLHKCTAFIKAYLLAYKAAGADGVIMAEPAAGLLSPSLNEEFSIPYVREIFEAVNDEAFVICYHNCGNVVVDMADEIASLPADIFHFGNAIELCDIIPKMPKDALVMGNVDPVMFRNGTPEEIVAETLRVYEACKGYDNFMLSSGCDIPAAAKWENIDAYFETVTKIYQ